MKIIRVDANEWNISEEPLAEGRQLSLDLAIENRGDFETMRAVQVPLVLR